MAKLWLSFWLRPIVPPSVVAAEFWNFRGVKVPPNRVPWRGRGASGSGLCFAIFQGPLKAEAMQQLQQNQAGQRADPRGPSGAFLAMQCRLPHRDGNDPRKFTLLLFVFGYNAPNCRLSNANMRGAQW